MTRPLLPRARPRRGLGLCAGILLLAGCTGSAVSEVEPVATSAASPDAPTPVQATETATAAPSELPPLYSDEDVAFLNDMIAHHEQAARLAGLAPDRTERQELLRYAEDVLTVQAAEIEFMEDFLDDAQAERGDDEGSDHGAEHGDHDDPGMTGMLTDAEVSAIADARGETFDRLFLEGMITHHEGALEMAEEQLARGSESLGVADLAQHVIEVQQYEIGLMHSWLRDWGLTSAGS